MLFHSYPKKVFLVLLLFITFSLPFYLHYDFSLVAVKQKIERKIDFWRAGHTKTCNKDAPPWLKQVIKETLKLNIPAGQVAFLSPTGQLFHCEYGFQNGLDGDEPVTAETRFKFASMSKIFTSEAVLDLIRHQRLAFSDHLLNHLPIEENIPLKDERLKEITVRDLLTHTAGFNRDVSGDPMFMIKKLVWCPNHLEQFFTKELDFPPSKERHYSNLGYCLLGEVIAKTVGKSFPDYMAEHFNFSQYGFQYAQNNAFLPDEVTYFFFENDLPNYMNIFAFDSLQSSAGLTGTAINLVKAVDEISKQPEPNILTPDQRKSCDREKYLDCYALGTFLYYLPQEDETVYIRNGSLPAFTGTVVISPKYGTAAFLGNSRNVNGGKAVVQSIENTIAKGLVTGN